MTSSRLISLLQLLSCTLLSDPASSAAVWFSDLPQAQLQARAEGKSVLIHFSGSDWCGWCIKLRKEVFSKPAFESYAKSNLVLVRIDFPKRQPQPAALGRANRALAERFQIQGYPTLILLDSQAKRLGTVGYGQGGTRPFLAELEKVIHLRPELPSPAPALNKKQHSSPGRTSATPAPQATRENLTLHRITGSKRNRRALINNQVVMKGETITVQSPDGQVRVHCVDIREASVIVTLDGSREKHEIRVTGGT